LLTGAPLEVLDGVEAASLGESARGVWSDEQAAAARVNAANAAICRNLGNEVA
jgi:hypothetical protein